MFCEILESAGFMPGLGVAMLSILTVSPAGGQTMAALQGRVFDSSGAALPGASVKAATS